MPHRLVCCLLAVAPIAIAPSVMHAEPATADKAKQQAARSYVEAGRSAQNAGDYDTAIMLYHKAYALIPHPVLLFDIAQAYRLGGHVNEALRFYRRYLKRDPKGSEARTARELIAELEAREIADSDSEDAGDPDDADPNQRSRSGTDAVAGRDTHKATHRRADRADAGDTANGDDHSDDGASPDTSSSSKRTARADTRADTRADKEASEDAPADEGSGPSHRRASPLLPNARIDVGTSIANRRLSYDVRSDFASSPPDLDTTAASVRLEGAIYPFALANEDHVLAGFGLALAYDKTVGLDVHAPGTSAAAAVDQSHRRVGARFRFRVGDASTFTVGLDYARRQYIIDRSGTGFIDAPDVDYASIDPTLALEVQVHRMATLFVHADAMLMLDGGPITDTMSQNATSFGRSAIFGVEAAGGAELALSRTIRLRVVLEYSRIGLSFELMNDQTSGRDGDLSTMDIHGAVDRSFGAVATIGMAY